MKFLKTFSQTFKLFGQRICPNKSPSSFQHRHRLMLRLLVLTPISTQICHRTRDQLLRSMLSHQIQRLTVPRLSITHLVIMVITKAMFMDQNLVTLEHSRTTAMAIPKVHTLAEPVALAQYYLQCRFH